MKKKVINKCLFWLNFLSMERKKIKCVFFDFDKDGNGYLEKKEFFFGIKKDGIDGG